MQNHSFEERRKLTRFPLKAALIYSPVHSEKVFKAKTNDISSRGIGLVTSEALSAGTPLNIWLPMPDSDERIHASGEVAWLKKIGQNIYRAGISLKDSTLKPIPIILRMIQAQLSF